ncbi:glycoside hydrolase family 71 protein [Baudoinia panamericana UAMH 10762]|uniref:Glycoside hydrolase family 71 protein n=1 Tax=Baudoinia panamericana (strain UAMH 10762) TaxID=717646 RepID=M2N3E1_BAUPA|nr:glycoside hydrolase family 71 protein [Baudoinia panamericana UAMH 10762]EMC93240.1 glycoside hydrolase family 71 protein [Baudoinia panamericana UAMH 10762]
MYSIRAFATLASLLRLASAADVFAHFMVQNTYAYDINQWKTDMSQAQAIGVDGFALNWIPPDCVPGLDWTVARINDAFTAAEQVGFKLMHSFDMSYSVCDVYWNQTFMASILSTHAGSSAAYRWNSNLLVSTYGGDQVVQYGNQFFQGLKNTMQSSNAISIAPALTTYSMSAQYDASSAASSLVSDYPSIDGYLNWQAWPLDVQQNSSVTPDQAFQSALKSKGRAGPYVMAVSPWQYKDLNDGNPLDAWVAYSDTLFPDRLRQLTSDAIQPDIIELLSWNDFCESHYLRDLPSQDITAKDYVELGDMGNYVWGQSHSAWRVIAKYYLHWWKNGSPPAITEDQVVFWHRVHPKDAVCTGGSSTGIRNNDMPEDAVFAWALVSENSTISMTVGSNQYWNFEADNSGPTMNMVPFPSDLTGNGVTPIVAIMRNGQLLGVSNSSQAISSDCAYQNYNPVVGLVGPGL